VARYREAISTLPCSQPLGRRIETLGPQPFGVTANDASEAGNDAPTDASSDGTPKRETAVTARPPPSPNVVLAPSQMLTGNLSGVAGADAKFQAVAQSANVKGTFIAYPSTSQAQSGRALISYPPSSSSKLKGHGRARSPPRFRRERRHC
jgi:hypothetical protein